ncbi:MAG: hypothetical protein IPJ34_13485 [Myxococcales bacterium]|nr:hypothetical protein [Myxococcales bacterium]
MSTRLKGASRGRVQLYDQITASEFMGLLSDVERRWILEHFGPPLAEVAGKKHSLATVLLNAIGRSVRLGDFDIAASAAGEGVSDVAGPILRLRDPARDGFCRVVDPKYPRRSHPAVVGDVCSIGGRTLGVDLRVVPSGHQGLRAPPYGRWPESPAEVVAGLTKSLSAKLEQTLCGPQFLRTDPNAAIAVLVTSVLAVCFDDRIVRQAKGDDFFRGDLYLETLTGLVGEKLVESARRILEVTHPGYVDCRAPWPAGRKLASVTCGVFERRGGRLLVRLRVRDRAIARGDEPLAVPKPAESRKRRERAPRPANRSEAALDAKRSLASSRWNLLEADTINAPDLAFGRWQELLLAGGLARIALAVLLHAGCDRGYDQQAGWIDAPTLGHALQLGVDNLKQLIAAGRTLEAERNNVYERVLSDLIEGRPLPPGLPTVSALATLPRLLRGLSGTQRAQAVLLALARQANVLVNDLRDDYDARDQKRPRVFQHALQAVSKADQAVTQLEGAGWRHYGRGANLLSELRAAVNALTTRLDLHFHPQEETAAQETEPSPQGRNGSFLRYSKKS